MDGRSVASDQGILAPSCAPSALSVNEGHARQGFWSVVLWGRPTCAFMCMCARVGELRARTVLPHVAAAVGAGLEHVHPKEKAGNTVR